MPSTSTSTPTTNTTANTSSSVIPPWQVRWKRPQWDRVVLGVDLNLNANDSESDEQQDDNDGATDTNNDNDNAHSDDGDEYKIHNNDDDDANNGANAIDNNWTPISCSSVVLTRREARTAILELHHRDRLLLRRQKRRKKKKATAPTINTTNKCNTTDTALPKSPPPPPPSSSSASKSIISPSTWFKSITSPAAGNKGINSHIHKPAAASAASSSPCTKSSGKPPRNPTDATQSQSPSSPTSFSTFDLRTPTKNKNINSNHRHNDHELISPSSSNEEQQQQQQDEQEEEEFSSPSPPQPPIMDASTASSLLWEDMTLTSVSEEDAAAFKLMNISQSQRAAAAGIVGFGGIVGLGGGGGGGGGGNVGTHVHVQPRIQPRLLVPTTTAANTNGICSTTTMQERSNRRLDSVSAGYCEVGGGNNTTTTAATRARARLFQQQQWKNDWDGFDNVVLSVTIFNTTKTPDNSTTDTTTKSSNTAAAADGRKKSGEVVVMELLSTKNPPLPGTATATTAMMMSGSNNHTTKRKNNLVAQASKAKANQRAQEASQQQQQQQQQQNNNQPPPIKISSSSSNSNSSLTSPSPSSVPGGEHAPTSLGNQSRTIAGGGGGSTASGTDSVADDSTTSTNKSKQTRFTLTNKYTPDNDDTDAINGGISGGGGGNNNNTNHTRVLYRRVLWWPSYIITGSGNGNNGRREERGECPSLVSLGRTSVWKVRRELAEEDNEEVTAQTAVVVDMSDEEDGVSDDDEMYNNNNNNTRDSSLCGQKQRSVQNIDERDEERVADAMDAFRALNFLGLGFGEIPPPSSKSTAQNMELPPKSEGVDITPRSNSTMNDGNSASRQKKKKLTQPLSMCFTTTNGTIHFFHALRVLLNGKSSSINGNSAPQKKLGLSNSFAAFLLGDELYKKVNEGIMPLSSPRATMRLTQLAAIRKVESVGATAGAADTHVGGSINDPQYWKHHLKQDSISSSPDLLPTSLLEDEQDLSKDNDWTSLGNFDASIDPTSLHLRTIRQTNVLTGSCITSDTSNAYLAICGKGLRRITRGSTRVGGDHGSGGTRTHVLGGFVTFVSLRHYAETRTVYVPFAPENIQPVFWMGMHFVVLLGEEGSPYNHDSDGSRRASIDEDSSDVRHWGSSRTSVRMKSNFRRPYVMAVRVDCKRGEENSILPPVDGQVHMLDMPSLHSNKIEQEHDLLDDDETATPKQVIDESKSKKSIAYPTRFQTVSINLPSVNESLGLLSPVLTLGGAKSQLFEDSTIYSKALTVSSIPSSPPGIVLSFQCRSALVVVNHTLVPFQDNKDNSVVSPSSGKSMSLSSFVHRGHRLLVDAGLDDNLMPKKSRKDVWCTGGQGWSLLGVQGSGQHSYFICWEGATDDNQGPYILPLKHESLIGNTSNLISGVMPLMSTVKHTKEVVENAARAAFKSPSTKTYTLPSFLNQDELDGGFPTGYSPKRPISITLKESIQMAADIEGGIDDIIVNALDSISPPQHQSEARAKSLTASGRSSRAKMLTMSHQEKSRRLLRQCSSWTQLDDTKANDCSGQVIAATIRFGAQYLSLTLRTNTITNPISTPFNQVLGWLCQRRDYYTAASVALSLLDDADAVYELCGIPKSSEEELLHHKGLLDGIKRLEGGSAHQKNVSETMTSLADMAVGCLIKGGVSMSSMLEGFLERNKLYNAPRATLMLVGATASIISKATTPQERINKNVMDMLSTVESPSEELVWPVRCLMKMAVVRNCLPSTILMLNATLPNELRWRAPKLRGLASAKRPSLGLFLALVDIILESADEATRYFLNMLDEESGSSYWDSIDDDTKLVLCLVSIRGKHRILLEPECRQWALSRLKQVIEAPSEPIYNDEDSPLPNGWLDEVVTGSFRNAGCDIGLGIDSVVMPCSSPKSESLSNGEISCYRQDMLCAQDLIVPQQQTGGLDFDLLIASLLVLVRRGCDWREQTTSTQTLLNIVCDMAGAKTISGFEPKFVFDAATTMRHCALSENIQAAAFLIGGRKGLVLECADLVVTGTIGMAMRDAEIALFNGSLSELRGTVATVYERTTRQDGSPFTPDSSHQHLLWLLDKHVLNVQTYGEFESLSRVGMINPVCAGRICFRAWYCLTYPTILNKSTKWLEGWLRRKLELNSGKSPRRLACAALVRVLLWADETEGLELKDSDDEPLLAGLMEFDGRFMAELAQACCGLIQSIPPHLAEEVMSSFGGSNMYSFEMSLVNSAH